jgi:hypothetical protein
MACVTEEIRKGREKETHHSHKMDKETMRLTVIGDSVKLDQTRFYEKDQTIEEVCPVMGDSYGTDRKWDKGTAAHLSALENVMMGKLCRRVLVLIQLKVGTDEAVTDHMVWVLKEWLQRRGITIYTDRVM